MVQTRKWLKHLAADYFFNNKKIAFVSQTLDIDSSKKKRTCERKFGNKTTHKNWLLTVAVAFDFAAAILGTCAAGAALARGAVAPVYARAVVAGWNMKMEKLDTGKLRIVAITNISWYIYCNISW